MYGVVEFFNSIDETRARHLEARSKTEQSALESFRAAQKQSASNASANAAATAALLSIPSAANKKEDKSISLPIVGEFVCSSGVHPLL
jgi:hypothetical protein